MAASKGSKGAAAAAAAAMEVEDLEGATGGDGAWGDDAELEMEEDGTIKAEEDEEAGEEGEGGWDVDEEDLELPPELLDTAGTGAGAATGQDTGIGMALDVLCNLCYTGLLIHTANPPLQHTLSIVEICNLAWMLP